MWHQKLVTRIGICMWIIYASDFLTIILLYRTFNSMVIILWYCIHDTPVISERTTEQIQKVTWRERASLGSFHLINVLSNIKITLMIRSQWREIIKLHQSIKARITQNTQKTAKLDISWSNAEATYWDILLNLVFCLLFHCMPKFFCNFSCFPNFYVKRNHKRHISFYRK